MKRVMLGLALTFTLLSSTGCELLNNRHCSNCNGNIGCRPCHMGWQRGGTDYQRFLGNNGHHHNDATQGGGGAPAAQVAYPYYTTRGPRDFLVDNPPPIVL
jgi:hypothetical protein